MPCKKCEGSGKVYSKFDGCGIDCDCVTRKRGQSPQLEQAEASSLKDIDSDSLLRVCLCKPLCLNHIHLKGLLEAGYKGLLHVEDKNGEFVKVTVDMLKST